MRRESVCLCSGCLSDLLLVSQQDIYHRREDTANCIPPYLQSRLQQSTMLGIDNVPDHLNTVVCNENLYKLLISDVLSLKDLVTDDALRFASLLQSLQLRQSACLLFLFNLLMLCFC
jgi:hypothetical protein